MMSTDGRFWLVLITCLDRMEEQKYPEEDDVLDGIPDDPISPIQERTMDI